MMSTSPPVSTAALMGQLRKPKSAYGRRVRRFVDLLAQVGAPLNNTKSDPFAETASRIGCGAETPLTGSHRRNCDSYSSIEESRRQQPPPGS